MSTRMNLYASLAVPFITLVSIGISYTNKVEGITKAIVGAVVFFSIFFGSLQWCWRPVVYICTLLYSCIRTYSYSDVCI